MGVESPSLVKDAALKSLNMLLRLSLRSNFLDTSSLDLLLFSPSQIIYLLFCNFSLRFNCLFPGEEIKKYLILHYQTQKYVSVDNLISNNK